MTNWHPAEYNLSNLATGKAQVILFRLDSVSMSLSLISEIISCRILNWCPSAAAASFQRPGPRELEQVCSLAALGVTGTSTNPYIGREVTFGSPYNLQPDRLLPSSFFSSFILHHSTIPFSKQP